MTCAGWLACTGSGFVKTRSSGGEPAYLGDRRARLYDADCKLIVESPGLLPEQLLMLEVSPLALMRDLLASLLTIQPTYAYPYQVCGAHETSPPPLNLVALEASHEADTFPGVGK